MRRLVFGLAVLGAFLVVPALQADDQAVGQRVVQTLQQQKTQGLLKDFSIDLQVEDGVVWLKGEVASQAQRDMVLGAVGKLEGVTQVVTGRDVAISWPSTQARLSSSLSRTSRPRET